MARDCGQIRGGHVDDFVVYDNEKISWSSGLKQKLMSGYIAEFTLRKRAENTLSSVHKIAILL